MKKNIAYIFLLITIITSAQAIADNQNDYGLSHTYGYFIQKKAAAAPSSNASNNSTTRTYGYNSPRSPYYNRQADKQARLRSLAGDSKLGSADRGWIKQEMNAVDRGKTVDMRNPPGKDLAHERGRENAKGYGYGYANLQNHDLHLLQHKYDDYGRANPERPPQ